jgi:hypothetical protein
MAQLPVPPRFCLIAHNLGITMRHCFDHYILPSYKEIPDSFTYGERAYIALMLHRRGLRRERLAKKNSP